MKKMIIAVLGIALLATSGLAQDGRGGGLVRDAGGGMGLAVRCNLNLTASRSSRCRSCGRSISMKRPL